MRIPRWVVVIAMLLGFGLAFNPGAGWAVGCCKCSGCSPPPAVQCTQTRRRASAAVTTSARDARAAIPLTPAGRAGLGSSRIASPPRGCKLPPSARAGSASWRRRCLPPGQPSSRGERGESDQASERICDNVRGDKPLTPDPIVGMRVQVGVVCLFFDVEGARLVPDGPQLREKPTWLLLHGGLGFDHSSLKPWSSALQDVAQLVYLDHRGNWQSDHGAADRLNLNQWGDDGESGDVGPSVPNGLRLACFRKPAARPFRPHAPPACYAVGFQPRTSPVASGRFGARAPSLTALRVGSELGTVGTTSPRSPTAEKERPKRKRARSKPSGVQSGFPL